MPRILELGAGENPSPKATETLDVREDLDDIDYPGVDIGNDKWPIESESVDKIIADHVFEHLEPNSIGPAFEEANRVLRTDGILSITVPHAGTWEAHTDPTHQGGGGWTPDVAEYFQGGELEGYYSHLPWSVTAEAQLGFPVFIRPSFRLSARFNRGDISNELVKIPFVSGVVKFEAKKKINNN